MFKFVRSLSMLFLVCIVSQKTYAATIIPDKVGMNVKGRIFCQNQGISNVTVSDGFEVTQTDADGVYYLKSGKKNGYVFISLPSNYEVSTTGTIPNFFQHLSADSITVDQRDFELTAVENSNHVMILMADMHLANTNGDQLQFKNGFYADAKALVLNFQNSGTKVYGLTLGDMSWDWYWYASGRYSLPQYLTTISGIGFPIFNIMGNHDNDPRKIPDFKAESTFKSVVGPSYYSFNIGKIHYVVLDDVEYLNVGATSTSNGDRTYNNVVVTNQMSWLKKDLAMVTDKTTPIVVAFHCPLYTASVNSSGYQVNAISLDKGAEIVNALSAFSNVKFVSGHTHINRNVEISSKMYEHNVAAVSATWWWTGQSDYAGNHICLDGSPGGYGILEVNNKDVEYYYKCIGFDRNQQFRSYDRNMIEITAAKFAPSANSTYAPQVPTFAGEYASISTSNIVLINVFNYDSACKLQVTENGTVLPVSRKYVKDPLHIISYEMKRLNKNAAVNTSFDTNNSTHIFQVTASSPSSTLNIKLTDRYGNVYTETMKRPKTFSIAQYLPSNIAISVDEVKEDNDSVIKGKYSIYTIGGTLVKSGFANGEETLNLQKGFYIIKTDNYVRKVLIK